MIEVKKILAPTDFSLHSDRALRYACQLAERLGSELHLIHVLADVVPASPDPMLISVLPPEFYTETEERAAASLKTHIKPDWGNPPTLHTAVRWGGAVEAIVEYASEHKIDLIVISTHGRTGLSHVLLGSVAERIVREAPCPVLTIRDRQQSNPPQGT